MEHKVAFHLRIWKRNRNLYSTVRLKFLTVLRNVDIEDIYAAVLVVALIGNRLKDLSRLLCTRLNFVSHKGRALFKATAVNNDAVFVFK